MSELHMYHFLFIFNFTCSFVVFASAAVAHGIIVFLKKSISYFMNIMYKRIFLNFGVISFINKVMVSLYQLHTYKFGLEYNRKLPILIFSFLKKTAYVYSKRSHTQYAGIESAGIYSTNIIMSRTMNQIPARNPGRNLLHVPS